MTPIRFKARRTVLLLALLPFTSFAQDGYEYEMALYRLDGSAIQGISVNGAYQAIEDEERVFGHTLAAGGVLAIGDVDFRVGDTGHLHVDGKSGWPIRHHAGMLGRGVYGETHENDVMRRDVPFEVLSPIDDRPDTFGLHRVEVEEAARATVRAVRIDGTPSAYRVNAVLSYSIASHRLPVPGVALNVGPPASYTGALIIDERWPNDGRRWHIVGRVSDQAGAVVLAFRFGPDGAPKPNHDETNAAFAIESKVLRLSGELTLPLEGLERLEGAADWPAYRCAQFPIHNGRGAIPALSETGVETTGFSREKSEPVDVELLSAPRITMTQSSDTMFKIVVLNSHGGGGGFGGGGSGGFGGGGSGGGGSGGGFGGGGFAGTPPPDAPGAPPVPIFQMFFPELGEVGDRIFRHLYTPDIWSLGFVSDVERDREIPYLRRVLGVLPKRETITATTGIAFGFALRLNDSNDPVHLDMGFANRYARNGVSEPYPSEEAAQDALITPWFIDSVDIREGGMLTYLIVLSDAEHLLIVTTIDRVDLTESSGVFTP